ncbi:HlyD family secretion protein [Bradyrhizobium sp. U87765 SZCCT0131]|uniref:HlyD family secretion protein n=1 Tax=unclassified Bradyrhizobium TaxID=2631580 RepID=UPI001BAD67D8|nr:HlyD family secretion protein [Bradyrhizobium sp. U87765 SZCCT0131]MBR1261168.1 HlyD family secretion protein [Bradyrhizobium sp. U87765 SZCCT0134]MBR1303384.1 HlyD family secretion protein [Bradyrhizobium sp. U87765 SZCCT0110]MBR1318990.1 HlyD family secretion protein [Bradyrhizobium sp. U87765 SZCCT0109]MBR1347315.1 HlyD family secretion protein [Bradyrhizobium sp. U87765 SZCCT0048]
MTARHSILPRLLITSLVLATAVPAAIGMWNHYEADPWTRDGRIRADVVVVAPDVSGLVDEILIRDNQAVRKGDVLLRLDPERFRLAVRQAEAVVASRQAALDKAASDHARYEKLSDGVISQQQHEAVHAANLQARAAYDQASADLDVARLNLIRSEVRAPTNGRVTNFDLRPGSYLPAGRGIMALIETDTIRVEGYFEETKLPRIHVGDTADIRVMGGAILQGKVESIAAGIEDRDRSSGASMLANINPSFSWVRLAQRIPVRIRLDMKDRTDGLIVGRTVTVQINSHPGPTPMVLGAGISRLLRAFFREDGSGTSSTRKL